MKKSKKKRKKKLFHVHWNYRVIRTIYTNVQGISNEYLAIHGVHYDKKGKITAWGAEEEKISGNNKTEIIQMFRWVEEALKKPVLTVKITKKGKEKLVRDKTWNP